MAAANLGVVVDATGKEIELPIRSSFKQGSVHWAFVYTGVPQGSETIPRSDGRLTCYLTRRLADVSRYLPWSTTNAAMTTGSLSIVQGISLVSTLLIVSMAAMLLKT